MNDKNTAGIDLDKLPRLYRFDRYQGACKLAEGIGVHATSMADAIEQARELARKERMPVDGIDLQFVSNEPCAAVRRCSICKAYDLARRAEPSVTAEDERALPVGVCWSEQRCDFYRADSGTSMGSAFYGQWRDRADEFPDRAAARAALASPAIDQLDEEDELREVHLLNSEEQDILLMANHHASSEDDGNYGFTDGGLLSLNRRVLAQYGHLATGRAASPAVSQAEASCYCGGWTSADGEGFHNSGCPEAAVSQKGGEADCTEPNREACPRLCGDFCNAAEEARAATTASASECKTCCGTESISDPIGWQLERIPCPDCAPSRDAAPQIKTWRERVNLAEYHESARMMASLNAAESEIADLRAALARAPLPAQGGAPEVKIERGRVWIVNGKQSFMLAYVPDEGDDPAEMESYANNLRTAISSFTPCVNSSVAAPAQAGDVRDAAVKLTRDDMGMCTVSLEVNGQWVDVIKDNGDIISHIVEPIGVKAAIERATAAASALTCKTCGADRSKDRCKAEHWQRCPMMGAAMSASQCKKGGAQ